MPRNRRWKSIAVVPMMRGLRLALALALAFALLGVSPAGAASPGHGDGGGSPMPSPQGPPPRSTAPAVACLDDLVRLSPADLEQLYRQSPPATIPTGKVRGRPVVMPGSAVAVPASRAGRLVWQGKVFDPHHAQAVNRFFGLPMIRGELYYAPSWLDGQPSLILDYHRTSHVYASYRDEIRQVAPGLLLGLMYERSLPRPTRTMFFALETD